MTALHHTGPAVSPSTPPRLLETTVVTFTLPEPLTLADARRLRGAVAGRGADDLLHQHGPAGALYRSPLVRYDTAGGAARAVGIGDGALLLRGLPNFDRLRLGDRELPVLEQIKAPGRCEVGPTAAPLTYRFLTPYLALNQENHRRWLRSGRRERGALLARVVVGNLLSFSQGVGLHVAERLHAEVDLRPSGPVVLKPGVRLAGFLGTVQVNYRLPAGWGLGKSVARGFGTLEPLLEERTETAADPGEN